MQLLTRAGREGITHEDLCAWTESSGEHVSKALGVLKRAGKPVECMGGCGAQARWRRKR